MQSCLNADDRKASNLAASVRGVSVVIISILVGLLE
jgi:hypothetical protein